VTAFLRVVVAFRRVAAGEEKMVAAMRELWRGIDSAAQLPSGVTWARGRDPDVLPLEDGELVRTIAELRHELAHLAVATGARKDSEEERAVQAALDGAEFLMRSEVLVGRPERIKGHLPSLALLVTLPVAGLDMAKEISRRAGALLEAES
jgi:hypothetical protein